LAEMHATLAVPPLPLVFLGSSPKSVIEVEAFVAQRVASEVGWA
jgi:hypothetical protein